MTRIVVVALDQLARPQPGGVATYVRGLLGGLAEVAPQDEIVGLVPRGGVSVAPARPRPVALDVRVLTRLWGRWPVGVPDNADVVHGPSLAGPYGGGRRDAIHSVAVHDLLWRDAPEASTRAGVRFHEGRLRRLRSLDDVRVVCSAPGLRSRLVAEGIAATRIHPVRLGVDETTPEADPAHVARLLDAHGVSGPYVLYAGTREPRKNIERLVAAHRVARRRAPDLGPLVIAGPPGWGEVDLGDAVVLGLVERSILLGLYRRAGVVAYVPLAEGWGLPAVEALARGTRVVASTTTPSVEGNAAVRRVDPLDVEGIAAALVASLDDPDDESARARRRDSVAELTWRQCALDHLAAWR